MCGGEGMKNPYNDESQLSCMEYSSYILWIIPRARQRVFKPAHWNFFYSVTGSWQLAYAHIHCYFLNRLVLWLRRIKNKEVRTYTARVYKAVVTDLASPPPRYSTLWITQPLEDNTGTCITKAHSSSETVSLKNVAAEVYLGSSLSLVHRSLWHEERF